MRNCLAYFDKRKTNEISRKIAEDKITLQEAYEDLKLLESHTESHSLYFKTFASAIIGFSFLYLQGGRLSDALTVMIAAALGYLVTEGVSKAIDVFFIANFLGSVVIGLVAVIGNYFMPHTITSVVIISAVMPIVPGVLITNAIQDLLVGNMMMFVTKTLEAAVTAFAIGAGVATVLYIF
ncbi:threonine/serine exporter family protein [Macrococcus brunensis]|uniref:threonine/serine exporter family protein n=1 Tax=Macrococcus brunensis TaxID=198483 RepID=UPI001EEF7D23|nr:threonine/serine exporter family protein [Macrococcus brunensis]ULG71981.1 threonine/serine exporter family protein [Macrococcus brunensis]